MKIIASTFVLSILLLLGSAFVYSGMLEIGDKAPKTDRALIDVTNGQTTTLNDLKMENGLLVIFSCNTCPFVLAWEDTYPELGRLSKENNIGMVLVNSNEAKREGEDSFEAMKEHYRKARYNTPYVIDKNHVLADAFGGQTTPHVFLFDPDMKLVYRGAINDKYENRDNEVTKHYLKDAIKALVNNQKIAPAITQHKGCSIKRIKE